MIIIDFTPAEEAQIAALASQEGLTSSEYVMKIIREHLKNWIRTKLKERVTELTRWKAFGNAACTGYRRISQDWSCVP